MASRWRKARYTLELAERLGMIPDYPRELKEKAKDRASYGAALMKIYPGQSKAASWLPFILARTLGKSWVRRTFRPLGLLARFPMMHPEDVARAGYKPGPLTGEEISVKY